MPSIAIKLLQKHNDLFSSFLLIAPQQRISNCHLLSLVDKMYFFWDKGNIQ